MEDQNISQSSGSKKNFLSRGHISTYLTVVLVALVLLNTIQTFSLSHKINLITGDAAIKSAGKGGKITIVEYSDFQCPYCGKALPVMKQVLEDYGDKVELVYKHFPLSFHPNAHKAAEASECAKDQEKFWEYHDKLFQNQNALDIASLKKYASDLGLDTKKFNSCLDSGEKASAVDADFNEGAAKGVQGTPTFFINGEEISGAQPYSVFKEVIDRKLSGAGTPTGNAVADLGAANVPAGGCGIPTQPAAPTGNAIAPVPAVKANVGEDDDPVKGDSKAPVTIIEFSDFQCPYCGRFFSETLPQIQKEYIDTGKVKFVYRDYPLSFHQNAQKAAEAGECADEQGKFWAYHDKILNNQADLSADNLKKWASDLGLDTKKFNSCLDSGKYADEVSKDMADGIAAGVTGTPGFFINGIEIKGAQPYSVFKQVIDSELAG